MDTSLCMERKEKILTEFCTQEKLSRYVLFLHNFEAHTKDDCKILVNSLNDVVWYRLSNVTGLWQPVDAGYAQVLKSLISIEHREWVEFDNYGDRWFCNEKPFSAKERRILINNWAGNAWEKLSSLKYDHVRRQCWIKMGYLISDNGCKDNLIKPEGLSNCDVPTISCLNPSSQPVINNPVPDEQHCENHGSDTALFNEDTELV